MPITVDRTSGLARNFSLFLLLVETPRRGQNGLKERADKHGAAIAREDSKPERYKECTREWKIKFPNTGEESVRKKKGNLENEGKKKKRERQKYSKKGKRKHNQSGGINPLYSRCNPRESKRRSTSEMGCLKEGCASQEKGKRPEE